MTKKIKLIKDSPVAGYLLKDIESVLDKDTFNRFNEWMFGETVGVYKGNTLIYKHDYQRFMAGYPPMVF